MAYVKVLELVDGVGGGVGGGSRRAERQRGQSGLSKTIAINYTTFEALGGPLFPFLFEW